MKGTMCDGRGGWTRVGYLNMTRPGAECPPGLTEHQYNNLSMQCAVDLIDLEVVVLQLCFLLLVLAITKCVDKLEDINLIALMHSTN